jgi:hypothetical protein
MKRKGSALLVVVIIMFFVFLMAAVMVQMTIRSRVNSKSDVNDTNAYYCAEAGVNNTINYLSNLPQGTINLFPMGTSNTLTSKQTNIFDSSSSYNASYGVTFNIVSKGTGSPPGNVIFKIDSAGIYEQTKYTIEAQVQLDLNATKTQYKFSKFNSKKAYKAIQP